MGTDNGQGQWHPGFGEGAWSGNGNYMLATHTGKLLGVAAYPGDLKAALEKFNRLPEEERRPRTVSSEEYKDEWMVPIPEGALVTRYWWGMVEPDEQGGLRRYYKLHGTQQFEHGTFVDALRDNFWISAAEQKALVPDSARAGKAFDAPASLRDRIWLFTSRDHGRLGHWHYGDLHWPKSSLKVSELKVKVEAATSTDVRLVLEGRYRIELDRSGTVPGQAPGGARVEVKKSTILETATFEATLLGYATYDLKKKEFTRFDLASLGEGRWIPPAKAPADPAAAAWIEGTGNFYGKRTWAMSMQIVPKDAGGIYTLSPSYMQVAWREQRKADVAALTRKFIGEEPLE